MKKVLLFTYFLLLAGDLAATVCVDRVYRESHLTLYLCQNYSNYNETRSLLYEARASELNNYILELIKLGHLENKTFQIQILDQLLTYNFIHVSRSKKNNFIALSGFVSLDELKLIVNYFSADSWKSFIYDPGSVKDPVRTKKILWDRINSVPFRKTHEWKSKKYKLWSSSHYALIYEDDALSYVYKNEKLSQSTDWNLPATIGSTTIFFSRNKIEAFRNGHLTSSILISEEDLSGEDLSVQAFKKWVNIYTLENTYSYSETKDKFYKVKKSTLPKGN